MNKATTFDHKAIISARLIKENIEKYADALKKFNSGDSKTDSFIRDRAEIIRRDNYDKRDIIYLYFYETPKSGERDLIGYVSCSASSLLGRLNEDLEISIPTVCINNLGVDAAYSDVQIMVSKKVTLDIEHYIVERFLHSMQELSDHIGINEVYTYAKGTQAADFYFNKCKFDFVFEDEEKTLSEQAHDDYNYMMIYSLDRRFENDEILISINT